MHTLQVSRKGRRVQKTEGSGSKAYHHKEGGDDKERPCHRKGQGRAANVMLLQTLPGSERRRRTLAWSACFYLSPTIERAPSSAFHMRSSKD